MAPYIGGALWVGTRFCFLGPIVNDFHAVDSWGTTALTLKGLSDGHLVTVVRPKGRLALCSLKDRERPAVEPDPAG